MEPPTNEKVIAHHAASISNKSKETCNNNASEEQKYKVKINLLKRENTRLRNIIKSLKYHLRATKVCRKNTSKKKLKENFKKFDR